MHIEPLIPDLCLSGKLCLPGLVLSTLGGEHGFDVCGPSAKKLVRILTTGFCWLVFVFVEQKWPLALLGNLLAIKLILHWGATEVCRNAVSVTERFRKPPCAVRAPLLFCT